MRDLLISMKSFASSNDDFYEEEKKVSKLIYLIYLILGCFRGVEAQRLDEAPGYPWDDQDRRLIRPSSRTLKRILTSRRLSADNATTITLSVNLIM